MGVGSAVSAESHRVMVAIEGMNESVERSYALFGRKAAAIAQVWALVNDAAEANWDGARAEPVDHYAAFNATQVIRALPSDVRLPEAVPEPDGSVSLDWIESRNRLFTLSVGTGDRLAYAWVEGSDSGHGVVRFDGKTIPTKIRRGIEEAMRHAPAVGPS